jgi:hypothetical protein
MPLQQKNPAIAGFFVEEGDEAKLRRQPWRDSLFVPRLRDFLLKRATKQSFVGTPGEILFLSRDCGIFC